MQAQIALPSPARTWRVTWGGALALAALLIAIHMGVLVLPLDTPQVRMLRSAILPVESLLAAIALFHGARRSRPGTPTLYAAWSTLALAQSLYAFGDVVWVMGQVAPQPQLLVTCSNILHALYYPLFLAGVCLFPLPGRLAPGERLQLGLDVGIALLGCMLLAWMLLVGPLLASAGAPFGLELAVVLAYPAGDLVLLLALLALLLRQTRPQRQQPLVLLGLGVAALSLTHGAAIYQATVQTGMAGQGLPDLGWGVAAALAALAGVLQGTLPPSKPAGDADLPTRLSGWQLYLPYASLGAAYVLLIWRHAHEAYASFLSLAAGMACVIAIMLVRQVVVFRESARLHDEWRLAHADLEQRVAERTADLAQINQDLHAEMQSNAQLFLSLQKTNQQLVAAITAKDEMLQNVSHELRTPVMLILGYVELLHNAELGPMAEEQAEAVEIVLRQGERLRFMVNRLLTLQTFEPDKLRPMPLDVRTWIEQAVDAWQVRAAQSAIMLSAELAPDLPVITADRDFLGQVLENLLDNAVKFTPQRGHITVRAEAQGGQLFVAVADDGIGIAAARLDYVFDRFYQVDGGSGRRFGGIGIGLALCRAIVAAHGGQIWVESAGENRGSTFCISLPLAVP